MPRAKKPPKTAPADDIFLGPLANAIGYHLYRAAATSFADFSRQVGEDDLVPGHYTILQLAKENPGISQTLLSRAMSRDKSTLTPALRNLEKDGLLMRVVSETDKRSNNVYLTAAGRQRLETLARQAEAHDALLASIVRPERRAVFLEVLQDILDHMTAKPIKARKED